MLLVNPNGKVKLSAVLLKMYRRNKESFKSYISARVPGCEFAARVPVKKNLAVSNLVIRWKTICHPFIQLYLFVSVSQQRPVGLVIPLGQAQDPSEKDVNCSIFFYVLTLKSMSLDDVLGRVF